KVYELTRKLPKSEMFGLTSQLNRVAVSVACNIAEGSARTSSKDQAHFSQLAFSSLMESDCPITVCGDLGFASREDAAYLRGLIQALSRQINSLRQTQLARSAQH
ncbi:MAG: four helix bundle protein, partial [Verrucomicrobia bacterium]|nr:four helix bundle protein [Verrucomicrobiota bacterium]